MFDEVIVIGGTAVQTSAYPTISLVAKRFLDQNIETHFINGATLHENGELVVATPRDQAENIERIIPDIRTNSKKRLFLTHCLGMAAATKVIPNISGQSKLVALAPPLPSPYQTINTPHSKKI